MRHFMKSAAAMIIAATLSLLGFAVASADVGAGIGADPILLPQPALPGHSYAMQSVYVVNTGTEPSKYELVLQRVRESNDARIPKEWVSFETNDFTLQPKESASVPVKLTVPGNAQAGAYFSNVVVGTVANTASTGATALGARAATEIKFQVAKSGPAIPWPLPWWSYAALGGAAVIGGGTALTRRLGISIQFQRRG